MPFSINQALKFFTENKKAHWPRIIYPAIACAIVIQREGLYEKYTLYRPAEIVLLSIISGGLFYYVYYFTLHKAIRIATYKLFGLPTFDVVVMILNEHGLQDIAKRPSMVQSILGEFFRKNPRIRSVETIMKSSVFHGVFMSCIIAVGYFVIKYILEPRLLWSLLAVFSLIIFLLAMWADHKFGENEECLALQNYRKKLSEYIQKTYHLAS